jgi:hypothetical protein
MLFHILTLSTFEPHPLAAESILTWPETLSRPRISLGFQIADDGLFVLKHNGGRNGSADQLYGWQWTTGRQGVVSLPWCILERAEPSPSALHPPCRSSLSFSSRPRLSSFLLS